MYFTDEIHFPLLKYLYPKGTHKIYLKFTKIVMDKAEGLKNALVKKKVEDELEHLEL